MKIFKLIEIDIEKERGRIDKKGTYNKRQRKVLHGLLDLFVIGEWQKCLDFVNNKKNFPYNKDREYPETEHIGIEIGDVLRNLGYENYYTQEQLLEQAKQKILK